MKTVYKLLIGAAAGAALAGIAFAAYKAVKNTKQAIADADSRADNDDETNDVNPETGVCVDPEYLPLDGVSDDCCDCSCCECCTDDQATSGSDGESAATAEAASDAATCTTEETENTED